MHLDYVDVLIFSERLFDYSLVDVPYASRYVWCV